MSSGDLNSWRVRLSWYTCAVRWPYIEGYQKNIICLRCDIESSELPEPKKQSHTTKAHTWTTKWLWLWLVYVTTMCSVNWTGRTMDFCSCGGGDRLRNRLLSAMARSHNESVHQCKIWTCNTCRCITNSDWTLIETLCLYHSGCIWLNHAACTHALVVMSLIQ